MNKLLTTIILLCLSVNGCTPEQHLFSPEGCDFSVNFPAQPELTTLYADNVGEWVQANYNNRSEVYFLRAECIPIVTNASALEQGAKTYAQNNGLENTAYEFGEDNIGEFVKLTGYKTVNDEATTFRVDMYAAEGNYISLYVGSPSRIYPRREMLEFFESLKPNVTVSSSENTAKEYDRYTQFECNAFASESNKLLPLTVDEYTSLTSTFCITSEEEIHFIYAYTVNADFQSLTRMGQDNIDQIGNAALPVRCADPATIELSLRMDEIRFNYSNSLGEFIGETSFRNSDCELQ